MYKLTQADSVIRVEDGAVIPADLHNADYAAFLLWVDAGNTPEPADVPPPVPASVTPLAFMEFFTQEELLTIIATAQTSPALRLWYDKLMAAQEVVDGDPRIVGGLDALLGAGLLTDDRKAEILLALKG